MIIKTKDFNSRKELEQVVRSASDTVQIKGTDSDLNRLGLSPKRRVYGFECISTSKPKEKIKNTVIKTKDRRK